MRDRPGAGANLRVCRDYAAPAGGVAALPGVEANPRFLRSCAALAGWVAFLPGVGANPCLRRDRAAPAGCKASGCSQVDVELDSLSSYFQLCMSPIDRYRLLHQLAHIHAGLGMAIHIGLCIMVHV